MLWRLLVLIFCQAIVPTKSFILPEVGFLTDSIKTCEQGWYSFGEKCYRMGGRRKIGVLNYEEASKRCAADGGYLATINSKEIQDFLVAVLLMDIRQTAWIGLHDRDNESTYVWMDGSEVSYTNWEPDEPSGAAADHEDCVTIVFLSGKGVNGGWNDLDCTRERSYICQKGMTEMLTDKRPLDAKFCSDESSGWKFQDSCFIIVPDKKTWREAEATCKKKYAGHLVTIKDFTVATFLNYMLKLFPEEIWIGIEIKEGFQQKWSSGWHVSYNDWEKEGILPEGTCGMRLKGGKWSPVPCIRKFFFMCEISTVSPPVLTPSVNGSTCPKEPYDWRDLDGDYCYFFENKKDLSWNDANFDCMQRGGMLASIHSQVELDIIQPFFLYRKGWIFIGLVQFHGDMEFVWADGTEMDFKAWDVKEPNREDEQCGVLFSDTLKWNDITCDQMHGYICSVKKIPPNITRQPEVPRGSKKVELKTCPFKCEGCISPGALFSIIVSSMFVGVLMTVVVYYLKICSNRRVEQRKASIPNSNSGNIVKRYSCTPQNAVQEDYECYEDID